MNVWKMPSIFHGNTLDQGGPGNFLAPGGGGAKMAWAAYNEDLQQERRVR